MTSQSRNIEKIFPRIEKNIVANGSSKMLEISQKGLKYLSHYVSAETVSSSRAFYNVYYKHLCDSQRTTAERDCFGGSAAFSSSSVRESSQIPS